MLFFVDTLSKAQALNQTEADLRNCVGLTSEWYASRETVDGRLCLLVPDEPLNPELKQGLTSTKPEWPVVLL